MVFLVTLHFTRHLSLILHPGVAGVVGAGAVAVLLTAEDGKAGKNRVI